MSPPLGEFTSAIGPTIARFVALKQSLGRCYDSPRHLLGQVDRYLAARADSDLTAESYSAWCSSIEHITAAGRLLRMRTLRQFCLYRRRNEPECFVPDPTQFPPTPPRRRPHVFSEAEIVRLLHAADALRPWGASPLHSRVARLALVLLYTSGLRRGEIGRLTLGDYQPADHVLLIRDSKFHKSRLIPLSKDAVAEIEVYLRHRRRRGNPRGAGSPLLIHRHGSHLIAYTGDGLHTLLRKLFRTADVRTAAGCLPRVHDLRFTFAFHALLRWYRAGIDVQARLPALMTYMGHSSILSTQYYLPVLDVVVEAASKRIEQHSARFLAAVGNERGAR